MSPEDRPHDSIGTKQTETNAAADTLFGYTGRAYDEETGLQNNLNRWYDSTTGRWISDDPIGFTARDSNLARYVGNQSTTYVDPDGLEERWIVDDFALGWLQGSANIVNGLQDTVIGLGNLVPMGINGIAWTEERLGILNPDNKLRCGYIPSPDWSKGLVVTENDTVHNVSKFAGATGVELLTGAWFAKASKA